MNRYMNLFSIHILSKNIIYGLGTTLGLIDNSYLKAMRIDWIYYHTWCGVYLKMTMHFVPLSDRMEWGFCFYSFDVYMIFNLGNKLSFLQVWGITYQRELLTSWQGDSVFSFVTGYKSTWTVMKAKCPQNGFLCNHWNIHGQSQSVFISKGIAHGSNGISFTLCMI